MCSGGGPKSREGGTLSLCRETYFHLLHSPLCSQLSGCLLLLLLVLKENVFSSSSSFSSSSVSRVVSIPLLSLPIIFWVCVGRMQIIISGWKGGRPNVEVRIPHILCWWHFFFCLCWWHCPTGSEGSLHLLACTPFLMVARQDCHIAAPLRLSHFWDSLHNSHSVVPDVLPYSESCSFDADNLVFLFSCSPIFSWTGH